MGCKQTKIVSISNKPAAQEMLERSEVIDEVTCKNEAEISPKTTNVIRADSEVTTDCIQVQETDILSDDEKITISVYKALKKSLPAYYIDSDKAETLSPCLRRTPCLRRIYIMRMKNSPNNTIHPRQAGEFLIHSSNQTTDRLHVCCKQNNTKLVKFLYQKRAGTDLILASPFHDNNTKAGFAVPCKQVSISNALAASDPIAGIGEALGQIHSPSDADNGFDGKDFLWQMSESLGNNFTINIPLNSRNEYLYWMYPEISQDGQDGLIQMTTSKSMMFHLELTQVV